MLRTVNLNDQAKSYFRYVNTVISLLLDPSDTIKYATAKKILTANKLVYDSFTSVMSETNAVRMVQVITNLASVLFQYIYPATYFSYFLTTFSGLKKIYHCIFQNPVYGILFYSTFYFKILEGTADKDKFNQVAEVLGLPKHEDALGRRFLDSVVTIGEKYDLPVIDPEIQKSFLKTIASVIITTGGQKTLGVVLSTTLKESKEDIEKENLAVYISERDRLDFDDSAIQDQLEFLEKNKSRIKAYMKSSGVSLKKKKLRKKAFLEIAQLKAPEGHVICLDSCKGRVETKMGCYCQSDCGSTTFLGGKKWCWVDKTRCKKGKNLPVMNTPTGKYSYDFCDPTKTVSKKCFTGLKYEDCKNE